MRTVKLLLLAVLVLAAGCGGQATEQDPRERLSAAQDTMLEQGSAAFTMTASGGDPAIELTSDGQIDFDVPAVQMSMALPEGGGAPEGGDIEVRYDGETLYLRMPEGIAPTPWMSIRAQDMEGIPGFEGFQDSINDVNGMVGLLDGVSGEIEEVGTEDVRGAEATHYRFTVNLSDAVESAPEEQREAVRARSERLGVEEIPLDVWVDAENRIVRQSFSIADGPAAEAGGPTSTTIEYYDFGRDVTIEAPPAGEVTDLAEAIGSTPGG